MKKTEQNIKPIKTIKDLANLSNYSFMDTLNCNPDSKENGEDYFPREVFTGHYTLVKPTPMEDVQYIAHSKTLFKELGFDDALALSDEFIRMFSGDISKLPKPMRTIGWACGYALSIYGREYYDQCPFKTGNGYGDGRAISILETVLNGKRWEMQLKGAGQTPYCRGADGRAVLRSSIREFLAQEHMYALGVPTSRSLCLITSKTQTVKRAWYKQNSRSFDPDVMVSEPIAISTRVAPSFIRVGQIELFARRARKNEHDKAMDELEKIVLHLIDREYNDVIDNALDTCEKVILLAKEFKNRLTSLVVNWIRVGYTQGNFNSDNCAVGGFTLDYGPFGFCELFNPRYQPWTGGGAHFSFFNQLKASHRNFHSFCMSLQPLLKSNQNYIDKLESINNSFPVLMQEKMENMWASKLGLDSFDEELFDELMILMIKTSVDYTIFFREISQIPDDIHPLKKSFYKDISQDETIQNKWGVWLSKWQSLIKNKSHQELSKKMKLINPKYILREWHLVAIYKQANNGNYDLLKEVGEVMIAPYDEQSKDIEDKYYTIRPQEFFDIGGISHISCSS